ncbi:uncharacterized protein C1orf141 homolog [Myotis myotis]|uniref:Uncharacterized protein n=1 Tax=Myotis myotis TaxID=51298 RepID=A0A7J7ZT59_MYOMY|nr:uncharacterized protein C1orf141 homolog [Myotis myotis]KAF6377334.1 hypothetical protein mMyoMyo1_001760 [Myotis myotis]
MAEKIVEKLEILNQQAKILLARRIKKNSVQGYIKRKAYVAPLTFDFQLESKEAITPTSTSMTVSQSREDKPHVITKTKRYVSFKNEPEPRKSDFEKLLHAAPTNTKNQENKSMELPEENRKSRYDRSFLFLKDTDEVDYAKPLQYLFSPHKQEYTRTLGSTISSPKPSIQSNAYKKEKVATLFKGQTEKKPGKSFDTVVHLEDHVNKRRKSPQMNDFCTKENKSVRIDPLSESHAVGKKSLLPLCFEDELKKPDAKIINISPAKTVTDHKEQNYTNPIIFHETRHVQMFLLTKNRLLLYPTENRNIGPQKRVHFALERNEVIKPEINNQFITSTEPKKVMPTAWRKRMQAVSFAVCRRVVEDKLKKKTTMQTSKNISEKSYHFSEPLSSLTEKCVDFFGKTVIQETSAKIGKFERMLFTVTPTGKFSASPVKCCSKPLKHVIQVHKLPTVTPLDNLLTFSSEN